MRKKSPPTCSLHPGTEAHYECSDCQKLLCSQCIRQDMNLFFCRSCGGSATILETPSEPVSAKETAKQISREFQGLTLPLINHIILPAAVILMVGTFLFFLLDVRSVFFSESMAIRRVAFCFAAATVLIARYNKMYGAKERHWLYTFVLAFATSLVMLKFSRSPQDFIVNILVVAVVWWFATRITECLDIGEEVERKVMRIYGVERLDWERVHRKFGLGHLNGLPKREPEEAEKKKSEKVRKHLNRNPSSEVARLAVIGLAAFALGEPVLLSGPSEAGLRAIVAVVVFLLATGIVMSAGSAIGIYRRVRKPGGSPSLGVVPAKTAIAFILLIVVLSASLTVPGIAYRGSGELTPQIDQIDSSRRVKPDDEQSEQMDESKASKDKGRGRGAPSGPGAFFNFIASLGKLLLIPLVLLCIGGFIYALVKLFPFLKDRTLGIKGLFHNLLAKLRSMLRPQRKERDSDAPRRKDLLRALKVIEGQSPRETILLAYECLQAFFSLLGYKRPPDNTPFEILRSLPRRFEFLKEPAVSLTELYVQTAYSRKPMTSDEGRNALEQIYKVKILFESYRKNKGQN
jgi:hypothetical protein